VPTVEIITIGTELLLGDIQDTNSRFIAQRLKESGYNLFRISMVGDNQDRIANLLQEAIQRSDIVITTGGLGPTVDDPTRDAVARAFGLKLEFHEELWSQITSRFQKRGLTVTENNRKQAYIPEKGIVIENKYGTAPGFILPWKGKFIVCLQGVPHEMERLLTENVLPFLQKTIPSSHYLFSKVLHAIGIGESMLDEMVGNYEKLSNPTIGLLAHAGMVDIRIVGSASTLEKASKMVQRIETEIREIAADYIYGEDDEKIEEVISLLAAKSGHIPVINLVNFPQDFSFEVQNISTKILPSIPQLISNTEDLWLVFCCLPNSEDSKYQIVIISQSQSKITRTHLGPPQSFSNWVKNIIFYYLWLELKDKK
jgi:nicotinamide-nucleotide amidase